MTAYNFPILDFDNYDGDSFDLKLDLGFNLFLFRQCRLHGVDTPELRGGTDLSKAAGRLARDEARAWVQAAVENGGAVFSSRAYTGKYGRPLGDVVRVRDGVSLVETLIERRLGVPYHGQAKAKIADQHAENLGHLLATGQLQEAE